MTELFIDEEIDSITESIVNIQIELEGLATEITIGGKGNRLIKIGANFQVIEEKVKKALLKIKMIIGTAKKPKWVEDVETNLSNIKKLLYIGWQKKPIWNKTITEKVRITTGKQLDISEDLNTLIQKRITSIQTLMSTLKTTV